VYRIDTNECNKEEIGYDEWMPKGLKNGSAACRWMNVSIGSIRRNEEEFGVCHRTRRIVNRIDMVNE